MLIKLKLLLNSLLIKLYSLVSKEEERLEEIILFFSKILQFHFDISANIVKEEHPSNNLFALIIFLVFHCEISGIKIKICNYRTFH